MNPRPPDTRPTVIDSPRSEWIRVRTLVLLRWLAIAGQSLAVAFAAFILDVQVNLGLCALAIGASIVLNLASTFMLPENRRLSQREAMLTLLFDLAQLVFLLHINGGLHNPFALLILGPVTVSATALELRPTLIIGAVALAAITLLAVASEPLVLADGRPLRVPELYLWGHWAALAIGTVFLSGYARRIAQELFSMSNALTATQMALAREHELTLLGGVVAAAAHEMGTPLATIKLAASELASDLADRPELAEDARLIVQEADRLREILRDMGRAGKDDLHMKKAPLTAVVEEAAAPHADRGKRIVFRYNGESEIPQGSAVPWIERNPEILHGLRNLVQNAVDFAASTVHVQVVWTESSIRVIVSDDGPGFPPELMGRIGDPFLGGKRGAPGTQPSQTRPGYEGMGLGLFIAKTLLERSGAELVFANASGDVQFGSATPLLEPISPSTGAIVVVRWPREVLEVSPQPALGPNRPI